MTSIPRPTGAQRRRTPNRARSPEAAAGEGGSRRAKAGPGLVEPPAVLADVLPGLTAAPPVEVSLTARAVAAEARYQSVFENATWGIFQTTAEGRYLAANPALARIYGYDSPADLEAGLAEASEHFYVDPGRRREILEHVERLGGVRDLESEVRRRDGTRIWVSESVRAVRDAAGQLLCYEGFVEDVTARRFAEERLRASEERYALAAEGSNDGLWDWDLLGRRTYFSPRWKAMLGYAEEDVGDSPEEWLDRVHPVEHGQVVASLASHLAGDSAHFECEFRIRTKDGAYRWVLARGLAVRNAAGMAYRMAGSLTDVTERRLAEERLQFDAFHDALTGLPNRALFLDRLDRALLQAARDASQRIAVLFIDLDRFKLVNDSFGHPIGDELLQETSHRLQSCVRPSDTVARLGGDEFVLLVGGLKHADDAICVAERVHSSLSDPMLVAEREVHVTASIGVVMNEGRYRSAVDLLRDADIAMYQAKARGRAGHALFRSELHGRARELLTLEGDLRRALREKQLRVYYQPIVELAAGRLVGFEALVRWMHPVRGLVSPADFIPLAEDTGLIVPIGRWVLEESLRQLAEWRGGRAEACDLTVSVNLSPRQLSQADLVEVVAQGLARHGIEPERLKLELTETALMENADVAAEKLSALRALGVALSLDDFGTGYSSLGHLHRFPFQVLKVDRSFVRGLDGASGSSGIVRAILSLARSLEMTAVAEGVETDGEVAVLRELGCPYGQGYLFSRPVPAEQAAWLIGRRLA